MPEQPQVSLTEEVPQDAVADLGDAEGTQALVAYERDLGEARGPAENLTFQERMVQFEAKVAEKLAYGLLIGYGALTLVAMIYSMVNPANGLEVLKVILSTLTPLVGVVLGYYFAKK
jgi:hypothetical protein